jgi:hypothetical protein
MSVVRALQKSRQLQWAVTAALAVCAVLLCWKAVSWALQPGLFLFADELGNLPWLLDTPYRAILHVLPIQVYNDRPTGEALERILFELFSFDYRRQLACFLCFHFANCVLAFLLFRRLGMGVPISVAATGFFGSLSTTGMTATYIGASFDVLCTFFLLGSLLTGLGETWPYWYSSALLFLLALRSKEFAIVTPVLLTLLLLGRRQTVTAICQRLWLHYLILVVIGMRYLSFVPRMRVSLPPHHPYYLSTSLGTVWNSLAYYTALIFTLEEPGKFAAIPLLGVALIAIYAIIRRRRWILFSFAAYILTLLPVTMLPNSRQPIYVYGPQIFLILAIGLFLHDLAAPWLAQVAIAVVILAAGYAIRTSADFHGRLAYYRNVREICARTARDAAVQLSGIGTGARLYIASGASTPWLMTAGPCDYLRLAHRDRTLSCVIMQPEAELLEVYNRDPGGAGGKYFVDYHEDGSLRLRPSAR